MKRHRSWEQPAFGGAEVWTNPSKILGESMRLTSGQLLQAGAQRHEPLVFVSVTSRQTTVDGSAWLSAVVSVQKS